MIDPRQPDFTNTPVSSRRPAFAYQPEDPSAIPCVTIVTPFFNTGEEFLETARSVIGQSLQQWEWIIVNDASTQPASLAMLDTFRHCDPRVHVVDHPENRGLSAARNTGWRAARTEMIVLLDSDDLLEPTAVEKWFWHLATFPGHSFVKGYGVGFGAKEYLWQRGFHEHEAFLEENIVDATSMVRRSVLEAVGGFDETTRGGLEDWDFWLHAAACGYWGSTVPEYLNWYRRRQEHTDRWSNLGDAARQSFHATLRSRYPRLWEGGFPHILQSAEGAYTAMPDAFPADNRLTRPGQRLLMLLPWLSLGGADKFNLDLIGEVQRRGWDVTVATTAEGDHSWMSEFARLTPDVFPLEHFLRLADYPRFIAYLIGSRGIDTVLVSNAELGYKLLPYLRSRFPAVAFVDYCHMEDEGWNSGGYPRLAVQMQEMLDLNIVSSAYLREWEVHRGADRNRIEVCTTNIDCSAWYPDAAVRTRVRSAMGIAPDTPVLLYPGRIVEQKQPAVFLRSVQLLRESGARFIALVAGDGRDRAAMEARAQSLGLEGMVQFLGAVTNVRVRELMMTADILFLPSAWEGIALTVYEAMASGLAVVGANVGGQAELVVEGTGVLVPRSTPEQEAQQYAIELKRMIDDPAMRMRCGRAGRERVERHFSLKQMGDRMVSLFGLAQRLHLEQPRLPIAPGLGRSAAQEALESHRNRPNRWRHAGITEAAELVIDLAREALARKDNVAALAHLRGVRAMFVRAEDRARVAMIDARIAEIEGLPAGETKTRTAADAPIVSVVIPCYDQAQYLREAMESVLHQTETRWEMIIVNDGSPDDTSSLVREFMDAHPDRAIRLLEQTNRGLPGARNAGCRAARGMYLLPLDADDRIASTFMARCLTELERDPRAGFAYTHIRRFGLVNEVFELPPFNAESIVHEDNSVAVCALMRRDMWEDVQGYNEAMVHGYEDWDFWVGCIEKGWTGLRIPEPLFEYRIKGSGALHDANAQRMSLIARIVLNHPSLYERSTLTWAEGMLAAPAQSAPVSRQHLKIAYLIHSIQGVTGGNQTLLHQANALAVMGNDVTIVTYSEPPEWMPLRARVVRVPVRMPLSAGVPSVDCVIATYFLNAFELERIAAPAKLYFAQGDQFIFGDTPGASGGTGAEQVQRFREMSAASYRLPGIHIVANSDTLKRKIREQGGHAIDEIVPVCVDHAVFHPVAAPEGKVLPRILVVGPDSAGTALEPLTFKGIGDIRQALMTLAAEGEQFEIVRISNTPPEIFRDVLCEFHQAPAEEEKTRLFGTADILVYASHYDSCPRPPLEGMAAGLAVVCTATEGAREYCVHGDNALLVPPARPVELTAAIKQILHDEALRARLREGALRTAKARPAEREWNTMASLMRALLQKQANQDTTVTHGQPAETIQHVVIPATGLSGPAFAQRLNRGLREHSAEALCVRQDGVLGSPGCADRLLAALRSCPSLAAVAPSILPAPVSDTPEALSAYEARSAGRRIPLSTLPRQAMMLRCDLVARVGLLDETLPTVEAVLDDLAFRILLEGLAIRAIGESAVCLPADAVHRAVYRNNPLPAQVQRAHDPTDAARKEVLRVISEATGLEQKNRTEDAISLLDEAIRRIPESPMLHAERAWMLLRSGQYDRVSGLLGPTPDSVKRDRTWLDIAGFAMQGIGETALARQCMEKSLQLDPVCAPALLLKGMIAADEGDDAGAQQAFTQAFGADPSSGTAHAHYGALLWAAGDREHACQEIERAFVLSPLHPAVLASYREMVHETETFERALHAVADARTFYPEHRDLAIVQAEFLSGVGENAAAVETLVDLMAEHGPATDVLELALALRQRTGPLGPARADGVSLCMIVRDEEENLARCLAGIGQFVDEIVVVDTGSTDRTALVAAACGAQVHTIPWEDDYAAARNAAAARATGGWILALDADERLALSDRERFGALLATLRRSPAGVVFTTRNYVTDAGVQGWRRNDGRYAEEAGTGWLPSDKVRLFPRTPDVRYEHPVHEIVEESLQRCRLELVRTDIPVHHYGRLDVERTKKKAERYAEIGRRKLAHSSGNDIRALRELAAQEQELGHHAAAIPLWERVVDADHTDAHAALGLGVSLAEIRRYPAALEALGNAMRLNPEMPEAFVKHALVALECGDARGARQTMEQSRRIHPDYPYTLAAHAAALTCDGDVASAVRTVEELRRRGIDGRGFFVQVARDLTRAGQDAFARCLTVCIQSSEGIAVES